MARPAHGGRRIRNALASGSHGPRRRVPLPLREHQLRDRQRLHRPPPGLLPDDLTPESVVLSLTGTFKVCKGQQCLGNPGINTPVLAYGRSTGSGPFRCLSTRAGVTCTAGAKGFQISRSGIKAVRSGSSK